MPAMMKRKIRYELISDLKKINHLRSLRDLVINFSRYHIADLQAPTAFGLADSGYKALVCSEISTTAENWKIAFMFRVGREKKAIWHTVVSVDYILIDPSSRITFTKISNCVRLISQFALKHLKASCVDLLVNLDSQLNPAVKQHVVEALVNEGMVRAADGRSCAKRLRSIDAATGKDTVSLPLPRVSRGQVRGMRPKVQSTIKAQKTKIGETIRFVGRIQPGSQQHQAILAMCAKHPNWLEPPMDARVSYMQTLFTSEPGDVRKWVASLVEDAHFIVSVDQTGRVSSFMAFIVGYSAPALMTEGGTWAAPGGYNDPERTLFVPAVVCRSRGHGVWTKDGFQQAMALWRMLFTVLAEPGNSGMFDVVAAQVDDGGLHSFLLDALGFAKKASFSNLPYHSKATDLYARSTR